MDFHLNLIEHLWISTHNQYWILWEIVNIMSTWAVRNHYKMLKSLTTQPKTLEQLHLILHFAQNWFSDQTEKHPKLCFNPYRPPTPHDSPWQTFCWATSARPARTGCGIDAAACGSTCEETTKTPSRRRAAGRLRGPPHQILEMSEESGRQRRGVDGGEWVKCKWSRWNGHF